MCLQSASTNTWCVCVWPEKVFTKFVFPQGETKCNMGQEPTPDPETRTVGTILQEPKPEPSLSVKIALKQKKSLAKEEPSRKPEPLGPSHA